MADNKDPYAGIKEDAERVTRARFEADRKGSSFHQQREDWVNAQEGVTDGTPVREAAKRNPAEPDLANFDKDTPNVPKDSVFNASYGVRPETIDEPAPVTGSHPTKKNDTSKQEPKPSKS